MLTTISKPVNFPDKSLWEAAGITERKPLPGEPLVWELCGQDPESLAFDPDQCRGEGPFKRPA